MAKLHFKRYGQGKSLIIMHGLYGSSDNWVSIAKKLMNDFTVFLLDVRNHGRSPHTQEHNYAAMTDDLMEFMNDQNIYSSIITGHSMGGKIAMSFAALYPERVSKLIIVDISPRTYSNLEDDKQLKDHRQIIDALMWMDLSRIVKREDADILLSEKIKQDRIRQFLLKNLVRKKDNTFDWKINLNTISNSLENIIVGLENDYEELRNFNNEVLFIKGGNSDYIRSKDKKLIYDIFKNCIIKEIDNSSHWVHAENPEEFVKIIRYFCL